MAHNKRCVLLFFSVGQHQHTVDDLDSRIRIEINALLVGSTVSTTISK
jgi:hypothetical protein